MAQTVYVDRKTIKLTSEKKQLVFYTEEGRQTSIPFRLIERLVIYGHCLIDTYLLGKLSENNITTVLFSNLRTQQMAVINGLQHNDARIHIKQYQFYQNTKLCFDTSKQLLKAKLLRQYRLIQQLMSHYPQHRKTSFDVSKHLKTHIQAIHTASRKEQLLGIEGNAARLYFSAYRCYFSQKLNFTGRRKRPPTDPVNAVLSLSYSIFTTRCVQALNGVGLDPHIGFYHRISYARKSLATDMIEPWRPWLDRFVWKLFKDKVMDKDLFIYKGQACLLNKQGRALFYPAFEHEMKLWQNGINRMARFMVRALIQAISDQEDSRQQHYTLF